MKVISFYNEKGGVGKSTFSILYASWLKYQYGIKVGVADFNERLEGYRIDELNAKRKIGVPVSSEPGDLWPIATATYESIKKIKNKYATSTPYAMWFYQMISVGPLKGMDVVIVDFPGVMNGEQLMQMMVSRMISMMCLVIDRDVQTLRAVLRTSRMIDNFKMDEKAFKKMGFINQIQPFEPTHKYLKIAKIMDESGLPVLPDMISSSERMKKINEPSIIRSTLSYPDWNDKAFEGGRDLGLENLFIDITRELAGARDIDNASSGVLSFVEGLKKELNEQQERRQLIGSSFKKYEFDLSLFSDARKRAEERANANKD